VHPTTRPRPRPAALVRALALSCHPGPTAAVVVLTCLLAAAAGLEVRRAALVVAAVLAGQLSIGWLNDLLDADRDRAVGRRDKPLAAGGAPRPVVATAIAVAAAACVLLSLLAGVVAGLVHLLGVAMGWAHDLGVKRTAASPLPYAVAFACLPAFVWLARGPGAGAPPAWVLGCGAVLGVGAHLLNALPDLADDVATGVVGLPQRMGERAVRVVAPVLLLVGLVLAVVRPGADGGPPPAWAWALLAVGTALAVLAASRRGRVPFVAAVGVALACVLALVVRA
jgi:4-hydroxybenzoate polyprenyltransferase